MCAWDVYSVCASIVDFYWRRQKLSFGGYNPGGPGDESPQWEQFPGRKSEGWSVPKAEAVWRHCLHILTEDLSKDLWKFAQFTSWFLTFHGVGLATFWGLPKPAISTEWKRNSDNGCDHCPLPLLCLSYMMCFTWKNTYLGMQWHNRQMTVNRQLSSFLVKTVMWLTVKKIKKSLVGFL